MKYREISWNITNSIGGRNTCDFGSYEVAVSEGGYNDLKRDFSCSGSVCVATKHLTRLVIGVARS